MSNESGLPFGVGELIAGKYRVEALIGAGGMGVVLAATHLDLDRKVAVKLIRPELTADESIVHRLMLEARAAAKIRSEHVGAVLDVGRLEDGAPYIVMEYLEGCDLGVLLERGGPLGVTEAIDLTLQACEALAHAHSANIVHRDLKPENLFVVISPDGARSIKVLDFGISKQLGDPMRRALTNPTTVVGSPHYMAPEQMQAGAIDVRVDVWALGVILYEVLSRHRPFDGDSLPAVCARVLGGEPQPLSSLAPAVPSALEAIIHRCLDKNPNARFQTIGELAYVLAPFGSSRAELSLRRISAVLASGTRVPPERSGMTSAVTHAPTVTANATPGSGTQKAVAVSLSDPTPPPRLDSKRHGAWALGASLALGASALGLGAWMYWGSDDTSPAELSAEPAASPDPARLPPPEPVAPPEPAPPPEPTTHEPRVEPIASAPASNTQDAGAPTPPSAPAKTAAPKLPERSKPRSASPPPATHPADPTPSRPKDAWDPGNFGGRR